MLGRGRRVAVEPLPAQRRLDLGAIVAEGAERRTVLAGHRQDQRTVSGWSSVGEFDLHETVLVTGGGCGGPLGRAWPKAKLRPPTGSNRIVARRPRCDTWRQAKPGERREQVCVDDWSGGRRCRCCSRRRQPLSRR